MRYLFALPLLFTSSTFSAGLPPERLAKMDQQQICQLIAKYYFKGHHEYYKTVVLEAQFRQYDRDCAEIAELYMMRIKRNMVPTFRDTLKEIFEPCPTNNEKQL